MIGYEHTGVRNIIQGVLLGHLLHTISYTIPIEIDTLEYQQTEKIETELKDVDRIHRIRKVYAS
jgi:hypothetical protein